MFNIEDNRISSAEALDAFLAGNKYNSEEASVFLHEALENGAELYEDMHDDYVKVIARVPEFYSENFCNPRVGIYFSVNLRLKVINAWFAHERENDYGDGSGIDITGDKKLVYGDAELTDGYKTVYDRAIANAGKCDFCEQVVGMDNLKRVGFANKACPCCYDKARAKLEYRGWCD